MTNAQAAKASPGKAICEWDVLRQRPSRLSDDFHAFATMYVVPPGQRELFHVCKECQFELTGGWLAKVAVRK